LLARGVEVHAHRAQGTPRGAAGRRTWSDEPGATRLGDSFHPRAGVEPPQHPLDVVANRLLRDRHPLGHLDSRVPGREQRQGLALARAEARRTFGSLIELAEHLDEPEAADHLAGRVLERDRTDRDPYQRAVTTHHRQLYLRVLGAVLLLCERVARAVEILGHDLRAPLQAPTEIANELFGGRVLPADTKVVVDDVRRHRDRLEQADGARRQRLEQLVCLHSRSVLHHLKLTVRVSRGARPIWVRARAAGAAGPAARVAEKLASP